MDAIEDVTRRYKEHVSVSVEIGHFTDLDKNLMRLSRALVRYNQQYKDLLKDVENGKRFIHYCRVVLSLSFESCHVYPLVYTSMFR